MAHFDSKHGVWPLTALCYHWALYPQIHPTMCHIGAKGYISMMEHLLTTPKSGFNPSITGWEVLKQTTAVLNMWTFFVIIK